MSSGAFRFQVGAFACMAVSDGTGLYPPGFFFSNLRPEQWEPALAQRGYSSELMEVPTICLLIQTGRQRVLIDTGSGKYAPTTGRLIAHLRAEGIDPLEIDTVVLSHAHGDHVSGILDENGASVFANARYLMSRQEWDFWMSDPDLAELPLDSRFKDGLRAAAKHNLSAIEGQLDLLEPETEIMPGVVAIAAFGHTPGHMAVDVSSAGERLLFVADAIVDPIDVVYPEARCLTDQHPDQMEKTRRSLLEKAAKERALVSTAHFPFPGLGRVERDGDGWRWSPIAAIDRAPQNT
jgi:glyoxylase-like metal-dependent hydrolase (beta-lactamase superfamily II)